MVTGSYNPLACGFAALLCADLGAGCGPVSITPSQTDTSDCGVHIEESYPHDGSTAAYYRSDLEFTLNAADPTGRPSLRLWSGEDEVEGEVQVSDDGLLVTFSPAEPLVPLTSYDAVLTTCGGEETIEFSTSSAGLPLEQDIQGRTWQIDLDTGRMTSPPVERLVMDMNTPDLLLEVQAVGSELELLGALADSEGRAQDPCSPTLPIPAVEFDESPWFALSPTTVTLIWGEPTLTLVDLRLEATIGQDGGWLEGGALGVQIDARELVLIMDSLDEPEDLCDAMASFGAPCTPCSSDGESWCQDILMDRLAGEGVEIDVDEIQDPSQVPEC